MTDSNPHRVSRLLSALDGSGPPSEKQTAELWDAIYPELHTIATRLMQMERRDHTLRPTALVHEAYMRLRVQTRSEWENRAQFFAVAARVMRRILVDHAREKKSHKRGGDWTKVPLEDNVAEDAHGSVLDVLALDQILQRLSEEQPRPASVVEMRVFGGLTMREIAHVLGVSRRTVTEDWNTARARLSAELSEEATEDPHPLLAEGAMSRWAHHVLEARERAREEADPTAPDQE